MSIFSKKSPPVSAPRVANRPKKKADRSKAKAKEGNGASWGHAVLGFAAIAGAVVGGTQAYEAATEAYDNFYLSDYLHFPDQCTLIVTDYFGDPNAHGETVISAADSFAPRQQVDRFVFEGGLGQEWGESEREFREALQTFFSLDGGSGQLDELIEDYNTSFVTKVTKAVHRLNRRGYENSTLNLSLGVDGTRATEQIYSTLLGSTKNGSFIETTLAKRRLSSLFGVDSSKLNSEDEDVQIQERRKLAQAIINRVEKVLAESDRVAEVKSEWREAVRDFEADGNSVVLAAGNSGNFLPNLNFGQDIELIASQELQRNFLDVEEVTSVGAIDAGTYKGERIERINYSSQNDGIDIWADGSAVKANGDGADGTSFAAPKVATTMNNLHCDYPDLSSDEIEAYLTDNLTRPREYFGEKSEQVLDQGLVSDALAG